MKIVRYVRKKSPAVINTGNTPFRGFPRDLCELLLDLIDTPTLFNLMLVSHNTKVLAYSEFHWKKRLYILFSKSSVDRYSISIKCYNFIISNHRATAVRMINRKRTRDQLMAIIQKLYPARAEYIQLEDDGVDALNETVLRYVRLLSMYPLAEFENLIKEDFPKTMNTGRMEQVRVRSWILSFYRDNQSRFGVVGVLINLIFEVQRRQARIDGGPRQAGAKIVFNRENVIIGIYRIIRDQAFRCTLNHSQDTHQTNDREGDGGDKCWKWMTYGRSNFTILTETLVNPEKYPYLADVKL